MPRLPVIDLETAETEQTIQKLNQAKQTMGSLPNIIKGMANSPAALGAYLSMSNELAAGELSAEERESIALRVAHINECDYCSAAHTAIGQSIGMSKAQTIQARKGRTEDSKIQALLSFVTEVVDTRGYVNDQQVKAFKTAGYTDGEAAEVVAAVAMNIYTNYFNHMNDTSVDFPTPDPI